VAPWGAVELAARWDARLAWRRKGSWTPRGRDTAREPVGREQVETEVALQLVAPAGEAWSLAAPRSAVERGEAVAGGALSLASWDDALFRLALDPAAPDAGRPVARRRRGLGGGSPCTGWTRRTPAPRGPTTPAGAPRRTTSPTRR
jgi:hypothetical protein